MWLSNCLLNVCAFTCGSLSLSQVGHGGKLPFVNDGTEKLTTSGEAPKDTIPSLWYTSLMLSLRQTSRSSPLRFRVITEKDYRKNCYKPEEVMECCVAISSELKHFILEGSSLAFRM